MYGTVVGRLLVSAALSATPVVGSAQIVRPVTYASTPSSSMLDRRANLHVTGVTLASALTRLVTASGVPLAYSPSLLPAHLRVTCLCDTVTVERALTTLLSGTAFTFGEAGAQVVLIPKASPETGVRAPELRMASYEGSSADAATMAGSDLGPVVRAAPATITGRVTDRALVPVVGALVTLPSAHLSTTTDETGGYRLVVPTVETVGRTDTLRVNRIGYAPALVPFTLAPGEITLNVTMREVAVALDQVVVTGTAGNQERRAQPAVVASIDAAEVAAKAPISNVTQLLEGRTPGIVITEGSGTTGASSRINIRGAASLSLSNEPLVFIDGVRVESGQRALLNVGGQTLSALNDLNPDDIERIEVVKGPAAATLYGADASAGVIQIITKKGTAGAHRFTQNLTLEYDHIDPNFTPYTNYAACSAAAVAATSGSVLCQGQPVGTIVSDNPLVRQDAFRNGWLGSLQYNVRGGGDSYGYYASFGADNEQGTTRNNLLKRRTGHANFTWTPSSKVALDVNFGLARNHYKLPQGDQANYGYLIGAGLGSPLTVTEGPDGTLSGGWLFGTESVESIASILSEVTTMRTTPSAQLHYTPASWFTNRLTVGADLNQSTAMQFYPRNSHNWYSGDQANGWVESVRQNTRTYTVDYLGNIQLLFGEGDRFSSDLSFGSQYINTVDDALTAVGIGLTTNSSNLISSAATNAAREGFAQQKSLGFFAQEQLGFRDRLFVQFGARVDRNSAFGTAVGSFFLPKAGISYVISEESFWQRLLPFVSTMRLRAAYGTTGRSPTPGASLQTYVSAPYVTDAGDLEPGLLPLNPGNPDLKPERGKELEAGFDAGFFHDRVGLELTYFDKTTTDLLVKVPQPPSSGFTQGGASSPYKNIGKVINRGFEFGLRATPVSRKNLTWDLNVNGSTLHNRLVSLGSVQPFASSYRTFAPGVQLGAWYVNRIRSVDTTAGQVIVSDTAEYLGGQLPTFQGSVATTLTLFGNLRLYAQLNGKAGYRVYNLGQEYRDRFFQNSAEAVLPAEQGGYSAYERLRRYGPYIGETSGNAIPFTEVKEDYIQPGDYLRFQELSATFSLPRRFVQRLGAAGASLTVGGRNLALWTKFNGYDPEVLGTGPGRANDTFYSQLYSAEVFSTPPSSRWIVRLNVQF